MNITDVRYGRLIAEHPPGEEECILAAIYDVDWKCDGKARRLICPDGMHFWPGVRSMPWFARMFLRAIGITKLFPTSAAHDPLYDSQGGRRQITINGKPVWLSLTGEDGQRVLIGRKEADMLAFHISRAEKVRPLAGKVIRFALRHFGKGAWDD